MITCPKFVIGHIAKTGGDAVKQICAAVFESGLEQDYYIDTIFGSTKHRSFTGNELCRVLSFRRLGSFIMSIAYHDHFLGGRPLWTPEFCCQLKNGDDSLNTMTQNYTVLIDKWLRCEILRVDLIDLFKEKYGNMFTERHEQIIYNTPTKHSMSYDHDVYKFFTKNQLQILYENNPQWANIEKQLYVNIPVEK